MFVVDFYVGYVFILVVDDLVGVECEGEWFVVFEGVVKGFVVFGFGMVVVDLVGVVYCDFVVGDGFGVGVGYGIDLFEGG